MTLDDLSSAPPSAVAALAGMRVGTRCGQGVYAAPCPVCNAERAHTRKGRADKRLAVLIRSAGAVVCCACEASMSRLDLVTRSRFGRLWRDLSAEERAVCLDAPVPAPEPPEPPPKRLDVETWGRLLSVCESASEDALCRLWAEGRGLRLPSVALAVTGEPREDVPLWTSGGLWLPDLGARLLIPCYDGDGIVRGARVRNVSGGPIKEQALRRYSCTGLVMIGAELRDEWMRGERASKPCVLVEGTPDRFAAGFAWRDRHVIGMMNGSWGKGCTWLRRERLHPETVFVHQEDAPDQHGKRKGQEYAERVRLLAPWVRTVKVSRVWEVAGVPWVEGEDLADLARKSALPTWSELVARN